MVNVRSAWCADGVMGGTCLEVSYMSGKCKITCTLFLLLLWVTVTKQKCYCDLTAVLLYHQLSVLHCVYLYIYEREVLISVIVLWLTTVSCSDSE